jgi:DNA-binding transcriptional LysR family regulator
MDIWQLHIYRKVIELKSFSKAGEAVHLSQPTVSSHIKDLEAHFGSRLVDRLAREAVPTAAGRLLYQYAVRLLSLKDEMESALAEFQGRVKGTLRIGGSTIPGIHILPQVVGKFNRQHPEVIISLTIKSTEKIIQEVADGSLELGLVGAMTEQRQIRQDWVLEDQLRLVVAPSHRWSRRKRVRLHELPREPFILRESGSGTLQSLEENLNAEGLQTASFKVVAKMGSTQAVCQAIKHGVGVSIVSQLAVSDEIKSGTLRALEIEGLNLKRHFYLTRHRHRTLSPLGRAFSDFLIRELGKDARPPAPS